MGRSLKSSTRAFLIVLLITFLVWVLRGLGVFSFLPGWVLWALILLTLATAVLSAVR
jgi:hypothetical protein